MLGIQTKPKCQTLKHASGDLVPSGSVRTDLKVPYPQERKKRTENPSATTRNIFFSRGTPVTGESAARVAGTSHRCRI